MAPPQGMDSHIIQNAPFGIVVYGPDLRYQVWNPYMEALTGKKAKEVLGRHPETVLPYLKSMGIISQLEEVLTQGKIREVETPYHIPETGSSGWVLDKSIPLKDAQGRVIGILGIVWDITQRKIAEQALQESKDYAEKIIEGTSALVVCLDLQGNITQFNSAAQNLTGYTLSEVLGKNWFEIFNPKDQYPEVLKTFEKLKSGTQVSDYENPILTKNQEERFILWRNSELRKGDQLTGTISFGLDITDRRRIEQALRFLATDFSHLSGRSFFEAICRHIANSLGVSHVFVGELTRDANHIRVLGGVQESQALGELIYELQGTPCFNVVGRAPCVYPEKVQGLFPQDLLLTQMGIEGYMGAPVFDKDHQALGVLVVLDKKPLRHPQRIEELFRVFLDRISTEMQRLRAEQDLKQNLRLLNETGRIAKIGGWEIDLDGGLLTWTDEVRRIHEVPPDYVPELSRAIDFYAPGARPVISQAVEEAIKDGKSFDLKLEIITAQGNLKGVHAIGRPVKDGDHTRMILGTFQDITESRKLEEALHNAQRLESLGTLAGGIAHDFNNLLTGIFANLDLARTLTQEEKTQNLLQKALNTFDRARSLTQQLLTFAKGGQPIRKPENLPPLIQKTVEFALSGALVKCEFHWTPDLWICSVDQGQLSQVFDNLTLNARQAMPRGGTIEVRGENVDLDSNFPGCPRPGKYVKISLKDQGEGIPTENLNRIFDPFFTTKATGQGLGLATAFSIINRHDGFIQVESLVGTGSIFHVFIPAIPVPQESLCPEETPGNCTQGHFLVMDDEEVLREILEEMLKTLGCKVTTARHGQEALEHFSNPPPGAPPWTGIILDLTIPGGMGGMETGQRIRTQDPQVPIIVTSGYAEDPVMAGPETFGFQGSLRKPFLEKDLKKVLRITADFKSPG